MISSDVDVAPRSLADGLSDYSQRYEHDNDGHGLLANEIETSSQKMKMSSKLTPAAYTHKRLRYGGETDVNSVAMTMKPGYQQMTGMHNTQKQFSRTLVQKQNEISGRLHRDNSRENTTLH